MTRFLETFSTLITDMSTQANPVLVKLLATFALLLVYLSLRRIAVAVVRKRIQDHAREYVAGKTIGYFMGFISILLLIKIWFGQIQGLAAYFGILSAGLAIALQDPLINLAGWIFITTRKPFILGDRIEIGEHKGDVVDIRLFQFSVIEVGNWVKAEQSTGRIIHIPNAWTFRHSTANYTRGFNFIWDEIAVTVTFESNWAAAKEILSRIAGSHTAIQSEYAMQELRKAASQYLIQFEQLTPIVWTSVVDSGVTLTMRYLCEPRKRRSTASAIWEEILAIFAERKDIDFAYPTTRFYDNVIEGKKEARAQAPEK